MLLKQDNRINKDCQLTVTNITGPKAIYLDQGLWAISVDKPAQMEIRCPKVTSQIFETPNNSGYIYNQHVVYFHQE